MPSTSKLTYNVLVVLSAMSVEDVEISERIRLAAAEIDGLMSRKQGLGNLPTLIAEKWNIRGHDLLTLMDTINGLGFERVARALREENIPEPIASAMMIKGKIQATLPVLRARFRSGDWKK